MLNQKTFIYILFTILVIFSGCSKDDEINENKTFAKQPEGNLLLKSIIYESGASSFSNANRKDFEYENGRISKVLTWSNNQNVGVSEYEYNEEGLLFRIVDSVNYNDAEDFTPEKEEVYSYQPESGQATITTHYYTSKQKEYKKLYYDSDGLLVKEEFYDTDDQITSYTLYTYDDFGNPFVEKHNNPDHSPASETHHFYKNNLLFKTVRYLANEERTPVIQFFRYYDGNYNLILLQAEILYIASSRSDYSERYEYY